VPTINIQNFITDIADIVGPKNVLNEAGAMAEFLEERRGNYTSDADAVVLPANSTEVASVVKLCAARHMPIVPQGGNTGLCGGAVSQHGQIVLNLKRLNRITDIDPVNDTMTVEAGCILADIQQAATEADRYFPLSLGAEGSCQIGGNLSTNAGGTNVLRYGNVREQVLGLQAVLPDGQIWSDLNELRKNNTGYDLRNLLVGSEGTLGIITAAVLKLVPQPRQAETAFVALKDLDSCLTLLTAARIDSGGTLSSFELIPRFGIELAEKYVPGCRRPLSTTSDWHIIMVYSSTASGSDLRATLESTLENALDKAIITDAVISASETQTAQIWKIREGLVEAQPMAGERYTYDVSVKISQVPEFIERAGALAQSRMAGIRPYAFGHVGDGNIHLSLFQPDDLASAAFQARLPEFDELIFDLVHELGGSFSAEHGVGILKLGEMSSYKDPAGLSVMRAIKQAIDPTNIMNPGKVLP
jgi:D-lactate dehydrogenase (cytochrome)